MSGIISSFCKAITSCWNGRNTDSRNEMNTDRGTVPGESGTTDGECEKTEAEPRDIDTNITAGLVELVTDDTCLDDEIGEEGDLHIDVRSMNVHTKPFERSPITSLGVEIDKSIYGGIDPATWQMVQKAVAKRADEMEQLIEKAEVSGMGQWENLNKELIARFVEPYSAELMLEEELGNKPTNSQRADYLLISPRRFVGQNEIIGTIDFWMHTFGAQVCLNNFVLGFKHFNENSPDPKLVKAGEIDRQRAFREFLETAEKARKPTLAMLNTGNHWMGTVADTRGQTAAYYIFDTNAPDEDTQDEQNEVEKKVNNYLNKLEEFSDGKINRNNTVYCGYPMQKQTSNACGPLACWVMERVMEKLETEPAGRIEDLFKECFKEWLDATDGAEELEREFARRLRALMFARIGAWSIKNPQGLPTGAATATNFIFA